MAISNLKEHFGCLLRGYIKAANIRQLDLAVALDLSPSAISQMLSGKMSPNLKQLDTIMEKLSLDRNACAELRDCLSRIRSGDENLRSPLNDFIKSARTKQGLSQENLSQMSGIPLENLVMLETRLNVQPTPDEAVRLAAIFKCSVSELWQVAPEGGIRRTTAAKEVKRPGSVILADVTNTYKATPASAIKTPVVNYEDLKNFDCQYDKLLDFAWRHMCGCVSEHKAGIVVVKASGAEFGWSEHYEVQLEIADVKQWIPGMTVLGCFDGELLLAQAAPQEQMVTVLGDDELIRCQWCWLVNSFSLGSDLINKPPMMRKERKHYPKMAVVHGNKNRAAELKEDADNE